MFLDDKLLEIGRSIKMTNDCIHDSIIEMYNACRGDVFDKIGENKNDEIIIAQFRRVNKIWIKVANILESEGRGFIKSEGFKNILEASNAHEIVKRL